MAGSNGVQKPSSPASRQTDSQCGDLYFRAPRGIKQRPASPETTFVFGFSSCQVPFPLLPYKVFLQAPPDETPRQEPPFSALLLGNLSRDSFAASMSLSSPPKGSTFCVQVELKKKKTQKTRHLTKTDKKPNKQQLKQTNVCFLKQCQPQCDKCQLSHRLVGRTMS